MASYFTVFPCQVHGFSRAGAEAFHVANRSFPSGNASSKNDAGDSIIRATIDGPQWPLAVL